MTGSVKQCVQKKALGCNPWDKERPGARELGSLLAGDTLICLAMCKGMHCSHPVSLISGLCLVI